MASAYETWAEPVSVRLAQVALGKTSVRAGDRVLDTGAGTGALARRPLSGRALLLSTFRPLWSLG
jgi:predicted RNA methylase